jgi:tetratricopeptide (TPR) repeat protein
VVGYQGNFSYDYILAVSYLYAGVFSSAFTFFKLARDLKLRDPSVLLGLAVLYLRRGETDRALDLYLEVQAVDEHNHIARNALKVIRKYSGTEQLPAWVESKKLRRLFPPPPPAPPSPGGVVRMVLCMVTLLLIATGVLIRLNVLPMPMVIKPQNPRIGPEIGVLNQEEQDKPVQVGGSYRYILTKGQVLDTYETARSLFNKYRDESSKIALNRLLESNAADSIKDKARLLISYTDVPGFDTLKKEDHFTYAQVNQEPDLYRGCYVIWRGMATNLELTENATSFSFLIGYDTRSILEGIVPVTFDFAVPINPEQPLEILSRIILVSTDKGQEIRLEGVSVHQTGLLSSSNAARSGTARRAE